MKENTFGALVTIALGAVTLTALFGPAAILLPLIATLSLVYFAFTTPPPPTLKAGESSFVKQVGS